MPGTDQFAVELAEHPEAVANILRDHTPDENGKCTGCHMDDKLREPWPCGVRWYAAKAREILESR